MVSTIDEAWWDMGLVVFGGAVSAVLGLVASLFRDQRKKHADEVVRIEEEINAVKTLCNFLNQLKAQGKRPKTGTDLPQYETEIGDASYLRDVFHRQGHLFSSKLHDEYTKLLESDTCRNWFTEPLLVDLGSMHEVANNELVRLKRTYKTLTRKIWEDV